MKLIRFRTITKDKRAGSGLPSFYWRKAGSVVKQLNTDGMGWGAGDSTGAGNRDGKSGAIDMLINDVKLYEINSIKTK